MDEQFLHYIWKYQKFDSSDLLLTDGQSLKVFNPGNHNHDSGPDFEEARIKIDELEWAGQIEIHINSSDWYHHNHQNDPAYENVVLHVVWNEDKTVEVGGSPLPTLELKDLVSHQLLERYQNHIQAPTEILCQNQLSKISSLTIRSMMDRVLVERLEEKASRILDDLSKNKNDWEESTYRALASNFGFSTNKEAFIRLTQILPFAKLKKVLQSEKQTESLIFGQAGFLEKGSDPYETELKKEFDFLRKKFQLQEPMISVQWKFGKLRPANFPTVRLSQFASLLTHQPQLFSILTQTKNIKELKKALITPMSSYWQGHYDFGKPRTRISKTIGNSSFENILINTIAPLLAAYARYTDDQLFMDRAIELLESVVGESNRITKKWNDPNMQIHTAFDSQALIHLFKNYCQKRKCLQCNIGVDLLNK